MLIFNNFFYFLKYKNIFKKIDKEKIIKKNRTNHAKREQKKYLNKNL